MSELNKLLTTYKNMIEMSKASYYFENTDKAILKLIEEAGELCSCYLKENNEEHMIEEVCDIIQATFKLAYIIQKDHPDTNLLDKLLEKNEKWRKSIYAAR